MDKIDPAVIDKALQTFHWQVEHGRTHEQAMKSARKRAYDIGMPGIYLPDPAIDTRCLNVWICYGGFDERRRMRLALLASLSAYEEWAAREREHIRRRGTCGLGDRVAFKED